MGIGPGTTLKFRNLDFSFRMEISDDFCNKSWDLGRQVLFNNAARLSILNEAGELGHEIAAWPESRL